MASSMLIRRGAVTSRPQPIGKKGEGEGPRPKPRPINSEVKLAAAKKMEW